MQTIETVTSRGLKGADDTDLLDQLLETGPLGRFMCFGIGGVIMTDRL